MKAEKTSYWILLGPGLLFVTAFLLIFKLAVLSAHPAWLASACISILLGSSICILSFKELCNYEGTLIGSRDKKAREAYELLSVLDESHLIYREKIAKLEKQLDTMEQEHKERDGKTHLSVVELQAMRANLEEELSLCKNQAASFQVALDDALDELRALRQQVYLEECQHKKLPRDLVHQHHQLREQFEEKSAVLDQTRRRLFINEGYLLATQKTQEQLSQEPSREEAVLITHIGELIEECDALHEEITLLETLFQMPKKKSSPKDGAKKLEKMLEFQFDTANTESQK